MTKSWWREALNGAQDSLTEDDPAETDESVPPWTKVLHGAQAVVDSQHTRAVSKVGREMLGIAAQIGQANLSGPLGVLGTTLGVLDAIGSGGSDRANRAVSKWLKAHNIMNTVHNTVLYMLYYYGHMDTTTAVFEFNDQSIREFRLGDQKIYLVFSADSLSSMKIAEKEVDTSAASSLLWNSDVGRCAVMDIDPEGGNLTSYRLHPFVGIQSNLYVPFKDHSPQDFVAKIRKFQECGINRSYLVTGPPGSGKTTFLVECAELLMGDRADGRLLVLTSRFLVGTSSGNDLINAIVGFAPDVLLLEDIDRMGNDAEHILTMVDQIRKQNPRTLMLSTANHPGDIPDALKRPGRLGTRLVMGAPSLEWRKEIIKAYCELYKVRDLQHLAKHMDHALFTHDYIRDVCENALVEADAQLLELIENIKKNLEEDEWSAQMKPGRGPISERQMAALQEMMDDDDKGMMIKC